MITEYNGHMYPTKSFDSEAHRTEHLLRHARVLDAVASHQEISPSSILFIRRFLSMIISGTALWTRMDLKKKIHLS